MVLILGMLFIDLGVFSKKSHAISFKEALAWTLVWIALAMGFYVFLIQAGDMIHGISNSGQLATKIREYDHAFLMSGIWEEDIAAYRRN
ncbi:MAG: TerC family protein, partial [Bacteroidota bacterium]|nr:TerC family protein [Bacteroidota bacterium]MDX5431270.1 TerC family protein [Bacteroidota bacterium]MDX5470009.1 TerC family protein [Bacteroidota bacterium]